MKKHFGLPLLPADQIKEAFAELKLEANEFQGQGNDGLLKEDIQAMHHMYYEGYWFKQIGEKTISCFGVTNKTNNVCESLHSKYDYIQLSFDHSSF